MREKYLFKKWVFFLLYLHIFQYNLRKNKNVSNSLKCKLPTFSFSLLFLLYNQKPVLNVKPMDWSKLKHVCYWEKTGVYLIRFTCIETEGELYYWVR